MWRIIFMLWMSFNIHQAMAADEQTQEIYKQKCITEWTQKNQDVTKTIEYQNFASVMCSCIITRPLDSEADKKEAAQYCMARTLIQNIVSHVGESVGLTEATAGDFREYCEDYMSFAYPDNKQAAISTRQNFCPCIKIKLLTLAKQSEKIKNSVFQVEMDKIAGQCHSSVAMPLGG